MKRRVNYEEMYKGYKLKQVGDRGMCEVWYRLEYMRRWIFWSLYDSVEEAKLDIDGHVVG